MSALAVLLQPPQGLPRATRPLPSTRRRTVPRKSRSRPACRCVAPPCVWRGPRLDAVSVARRRRGSRPALHCTTWLADHEQYPTPLAASGIYRSEPASHRRSRMRGSVVRFSPLFLYLRTQRATRRPLRWGAGALLGAPRSLPLRAKVIRRPTDR